MNEKRNEENTSAKASPSSISEVYKHNNTGKTKPSTNKGTKGRGRRSRRRNKRTRIGHCKPQKAK